MPLFKVKMTLGDEFREIELEALDADEAKFLCDKQARELAQEEAGPDVDARAHLYKIASVKEV